MGPPLNNRYRLEVLNCLAMKIQDLLLILLTLILLVALFGVTIVLNSVSTLETLSPSMWTRFFPATLFQVKTSMVARLQTLLTPMMDNLYLDTYFYFVPNRIVWQHWRELMGENTQSAWIPSVEYSVPQVTAPDGGWSIGSIADYMGIPTGVENLSVNALPFRAYALVMNEWFRDENLSDPLNIPVDDATLVGSNGTNYITDVVKGGMPFRAAKFHDYFTSALPAPQKGPDVTIPVSPGANYPVVPLADSVPEGLI